MFLDAKTIRDGSTLKADICIIGAGIAGITIARELIDTKLDVILLESGENEPKAELHDLNAGKNVGLPYYDLEDARVRAFGGTSQGWIIDINNKGQLGVRLRALDEIDFEQRDWIPYSGWPFDKEHLDPFYERAHDIFKIGPYNYSPDYWKEAHENNQLPFERENIKTNIFQFARKNIFYNDYRKELEKADNITVYLNATVQQLETNEYAKKVHRVSVASNTTNNHFSVESSEFVLAAGGLENPRLLLLSNDVMNGGLGNQNDLVGRFFMEHPHLSNGIFYPSDLKVFDYAKFYGIHESNGVPIMAKLTLDETVLREEQLLNFTTSINLKPMLVLQETMKSGIILKKIATHGALPDNLIRHIKKMILNLDCLTYAGLRKMVGGDKEKWYKPRKRYHGFKLSIMAEQLPDPESRVMLDSERDRFGQQRIKLDWKINSFDLKSIRKSLEILDRELRRESLGRLDIELNDDKNLSKIKGGWHHMGTTRMHVDPQQGVVDENCRVHDIENLFVAGSSVFPTGGYANPTLTIVALSVRLADHLKKRWSGY